MIALVLALGGDPPAASGASTPPDGEATPVPRGGPGGTWRLLFKDEFSGSSLDLATWRPNWFGASDTEITEAPDVTHSDSCTDPELAHVSGGALRLSVEPRSCAGHEYAGSLVSSNPVGGGHFQFTYGYIEFRAVLPAADRAWSSLWVNGQTWPDDGEIDVLESGLPSASAQKWHYHDSTVGVAGGRVEVPGASTGWHTYAASWEPGQVRWYYDGALVATVATGPIGSPHYVVMNTADWGRSSKPTAPDATRVDYVRVWKRAPDPVPAAAASASVSGTTLLVKATPGSKDNLRVSRASGAKLRVTNYPGGSHPGSRVHAGAGCTQSGERATTCGGEISRVRVTARGGADKVVNATGVRSSLLGGDANDTLIGGRGRDTLIGGPGADSTKGGKGKDVLWARDLVSDRGIGCGPGRDKANLDRLPKDSRSVISACERKRRH
jgi:beta-glucanase (GH16 family)